MTQRTASWEIWHLERGFELLRTFGLVRWGLGGGGHVEGTGEKLSFASQAARYPVTVFPHKSLNSCRGVISEPDLLGTSDSEILEGFSGQGVTQVRRITIKKDSTIIPTKHLILTFTSPTLPQTIKAGYLNCKIRPYIPNPLRCFQCQRFGHSQTACRGQLTCSRCASVGHASSDCTLEQKCVNCSQPHSADSKLCPKWKIEKEIQTIKTNRNISYIEARKFITPQPSQTYAQVAKSMTVNNSSQTDETITKIVCPPLKLLQPLITILKPIMSPSIPEVIKSSTSTQAELVPSTSSVTVASPSQSSPPNSVIDTTPTTSNSLSISAASSSSKSVIPPPSDSYKVQDAKKLAKARSRKRKKELLKKMKEAIVDIKMNPHRPKKPASDESTSDEEEMIVYDVEDEIESNPDYVKENVYQAIVLSRIDYGCVAYGSACNSTLQKLDPVHHMALRICSGAFRTSPVQSLYVNCHQLPLDLRRRKLSLAFYFKILSVPSHPLQNVYMSTSMKRLYDARPSNIRPFMDRMKLHISELDLPNVHIQQRNLFLFQPWNTPRFPYINPFATYSKSTVAPVVFQRVFAYHRSQYSRYSTIYTDGSKRADYVGCGVVIEDIMHGYRLDTSCSIFTAEAVAIYRALQLIDPLRGSPSLGEYGVHAPEVP
ncbi:RNase H domain-containing protein [Trichonephila clavipes]|nr:RNase H domain-containing protein [Trichonephila clavipes]